MKKASPKDMSSCHCPANIGNEHLEACPHHKPPHDPVDHPSHYTSHPSGVECIQVTEWMNFNQGNALKYLWRAGQKGCAVEDLKKAAWYILREIARLEGKAG